MTDSLEGGSAKREDSPASKVLVQLTTDKTGAKLVCPLCESTLTSLNGYVRHMKKHESPGGFCCNYCDERFCMEDALKKHKDEKHKVLACRICHATFTTASEYRGHIKDVHKGVDRLMAVCEKCGAEFKTSQAAKRHADTQCGQIKPHPCDECEMAFYTKYNLAEHKKIHRGEKKFCCSYCGKSFLSNGRLVIHERSHTGEKPYKCDVCGKCFAHRESIVTHSSIHTGIKLVVCKCCGARFSCHSNLIKHRRTRQETCGLPMYDSTKETKRSRISRIPASLMSSEIKIVQASKVINPNEERKKPIASRAKHKVPKPEIEQEEVIIKRPRRSQRSDESMNPNTANELCASTEKEHEEESHYEDCSFENCPDSDESSQIEEPEVKPPSLSEILNETPLKSEEEIKLPEHDEFLDKFLADINEDVKDGLLKDVKEESPTTAKAECILLKPCKVVLEEVSLKYPNLHLLPQSSNATPSENELDKPKPKRHRSALRKKLRIFKKDRVYNCKFCVKIYHIRKPYEKHLIQEHNKTDEELRSIFKDEDNDIPAEFVHRCPICSKVYLMAKRLKTHITYHGRDGKLIHKCPCYCKSYFRTKEEAMEHAKINHKTALYCDICDKYTQSPEALKIHKRNHFERRKQTDRNLICDKCAKSFASRTSLNDHTRSNCGQNPLYRCGVCGKSFTTAGILKTHSLLHKDETPFVCDKCGKAFKIQSQYKTHLRHKHSNDKPFKCELCPKQYPYRESLLTHMAIHTGLKRYACSGCSKRFTCISNLQAHRRVYADTCGLTPLNSKPSQYIGMQKGLLLMGNKPTF